MTKEEIEQAAHRYLMDNEHNHDTAIQDGFKAGVKYGLQSENERLKAEMEIEIINFATWYSCESEGTVKSAYNRYKKSQPHKQ